MITQHVTVSDFQAHGNAMKWSWSYSSWCKEILDSLSALNILQISNCQRMATSIISPMYAN